MKQNGVAFTAVQFTMLIGHLLHDGDLDAAQHVYDAEMLAAGIAPDDRTKHAMARAPKLASMGQHVSYLSTTGFNLF